MESEATHLLNLQQIHKVFNEGTLDEKIALGGINLKLERGDFMTVIGGNGAGKSTLMNMISGRLTPDYGTVSINATNVTKMNEHGRSRFIGRVFQDPMFGTAPTMTIEENLALALGRKEPRTLRFGVSKERREFFKNTLQSLHLGLENRLNAKVGLLSGGERQSLSLLMATFTGPDLLLLDEHTAALDPARAALVTNLTEEIVTSNQLTTLMITHNMEQALKLGNRLIMMDAGRIILEVHGEEKKKLTVPGLLEQFQKIRGVQFNSDRAVLA